MYLPVWFKQKKNLMLNYSEKFHMHLCVQDVYSEKIYKIHVFDINIYLTHLIANKSIFTWKI